MLNKWICENCGIRFSTYHKTRKFCSQRCMGISNRRRVDAPCSICGKVVTRWPSQGLATHKNIFCSLVCKKQFLSKYNKDNGITPWTRGLDRNKCIKAISGENSHMWKGGLSDKTQRKLYLKKMCDRCKGASGCEYLCLDHINGVHEDKRKTNVQTLCRTCHRNKHEFFDEVLGFKRSFIDDDLIATGINSEFIRRWQDNIRFKKQMLEEIRAKGLEGQRVVSQIKRELPSQKTPLGWNGWNKQCRICSKFVNKEGICINCQTGQSPVPRHIIVHYWGEGIETQTYCNLYRAHDTKRTGDWREVTCKQCLGLKLRREGMKNMEAEA